MEMAMINTKDTLITAALQPGAKSEKSDETEGRRVSETSHPDRGSTEGPERKERPKVRLKNHLNRQIRLEVDDELHSIIFKLIDKESGRVIRQIPPEEFIELAKKMRQMDGLLIDKEA